MRYFWLPYPEKLSHVDLLCSMTYDDCILPFYNGFPANERAQEGLYRDAGRWCDLKEDDELYMSAHGMRYSSRYVVMGLAEESTLPVRMSAASFASLLCFAMGPQIRLRLHFILSSCFGANAFFFWKSFGGQLARAMRSHGFRGKLSAFKGATGMYGNRGWQGGSGRISFLLLRNRSAGPRTVDAAKTWELNS